jgi:hypothetical protein
MAMVIVSTREQCGGVQVVGADKVTAGFHESGRLSPIMIITTIIIVIIVIIVNIIIITIITIIVITIIALLPV